MSIHSLNRIENYLKIICKIILFIKHSGPQIVTNKGVFLILKMNWINQIIVFHQLFLSAKELNNTKYRRLNGSNPTKADSWRWHRKWFGWVVFIYKNGHSKWELLIFAREWHFARLDGSTAVDSSLYENYLSMLMYVYIIEPLINSLKFLLYWRSPVAAL